MKNTSKNRNYTTVKDPTNNFMKIYLVRENNMQPDLPSVLIHVYIAEAEEGL